MNLFKEFRPALFFLSKFLGIYLIGNILYGVYVESYDEKPDPITYRVSNQTSSMLNFFGSRVRLLTSDEKPTVNLMESENKIIGIFEGCNGLNVIIIFIAFIIAFGGPVNKMIWYIPLGIIVIHFFNLIRLILLFYMARDFQDFFYFFHKFLFTAFIYFIVFLLWIGWVARFAKPYYLRK